jgi:hypothetical protein
MQGFMNIAKDKIRMFIYILNAYAILIFLGTIAPLICGIDTPTIYYTIISIAFVLCYSILLLLWDSKMLKRRNMAMMAISTGITMLIALAYGAVNYGWYILLWICLMPLSLWIVSGYITQGWRYYLLHIGMVLMIAGAVLSCVFSSESYILAQPDELHFTVNGKEIAIEELLKNDFVIFEFKIPYFANGLCVCVSFNF